MNPFLQDVGRVCCQEVGSLFCHELERKGVQKYKSAHLQIFSSAAEFHYPIQIFLGVVQEGFFGGKKKGANPQSPSERTETQMNQILMSILLFLLGTVALCPLTSFLVSQCCC